MGTNTGLGIGIGIPFKNNALGGDRPYLPPELKARLIGVWDNYGKKNTDADRNIIKNKIPNAGGDLEILNAAYKLNSGFGKYSEDFTTWTKSGKITSVDSESFDFVSDANFNLLYYKSNIGKDIPSFKVRIKLKEKGKVFYNYITSEGVFTNKVITSEEYVVPISYNTKYTGETPVNCGFSIDITSEECSGTITQIPNFEGAFVTDGIDDLITSTKTVQEMLGGSDEITVVSMIHQIGLIQVYGIALTNYIRNNGGYLRSAVNSVGKTGIYGYTANNLNQSIKDRVKVINTILGDKKDYMGSISDSYVLDDSLFHVQNYTHDGIIAGDGSQLAWYWTFIANKVLTTDQINQVIAYFNLDRTLKPDILCNISKQGITNDNHAEFNDKLIDYSGNGRDIQMNNLAWKGGSGIAAKQYETFKDWTSESSSTSIITQIDEFTRIVESTTNGYWVSRIRRDSDLNKVYDAINVYLYQDNNFLVHECKYEVDGIKYAIPINESVGKGYHKLEMYTKDRYTELPENAENVVLSEWYFPKSTKGSIKYSIIPSCKGGILLDGINDFGKVIDMPIYKDYTFIIDRQIISIGDTAGVVASKSESAIDITKQGAFLFEYLGAPNNISTWSFYNDNHKVGETDFTKSISYQSKYSYNGVKLLAGTALDSDKLWLGTLNDKDSRFANVAIYSLMSFPYSMSKFLIERQLKKHKLGTFYPNMVEFRPVIKANANYKITYYQIDSTNTWKSIKVGDYIVIGAKLAFQITFDNDASELKEVVSPQLSGIIVEKRPSNPGYNIYSYITSKSPQKINITVDEYIRYEDIVQPYPLFFEFTDENGNLISWGGKAKVGSTITRTKGVNYANLLEGLFTITNPRLNGVPLASSQHVVEKSMVFTCTATWAFDNNEPKCILSPRLLRIPNSSYKILGYIPDISGHGNHGKINNSAYAEGSGVNEDGSYQFDGVDDFVTIPTTVGGKQVLMKVNWNSLNHVLYDQRNNAEAPFCIVAASRAIAYNQRNVGGNTYIDGILNNHILVDDLQAITHNIVLNNDYNVANSNSFIGTNYTKSIYAKMSLYDFMLFDEISTDDKIKELNKYVGVEAKVELPPYYWDNYGKTNSDADRDVIQQRGIAVGDYDLTNYNHAYEGMSGYNGYPVVFGANKTWEILSSVYSYISDVTSTTIHVTMVKNAGTGLLFSYVKKDEALTNIKEIPAFRVTIKGLEGNSKFGYRYLATEDATGETLVYLGNGTHELAKSFAPTEALLDLTRNAWVGIFITPMVEGEVVFDCDITIEVLPEYENGLAYDSVEDFSDNKNVPIIDDFTVIAKRTWLEENTSDKPFVIKGDTLYSDGNKNAFLFEYGKLSTYSFGQNNKYDESVVPSLISWATPTSYNGTTSLVRGSAIDTVGIDIAHATKIVLYKLILYPKTIPLLQINFLKNLMEKDEIIDLTNPIFIKNE